MATQLVDKKGVQIDRYKKMVVVAKARRDYIFDLKLQGFTYRQIFGLLKQNHPEWLSPKYDERNVYQDVEVTAARLEKETMVDVRHLRRMELERLDQLYMVAHSAALGGDLKAIDRCLKIMIRRAKLLGMDTPQNVNVRTWQSEVLDLIRSGKANLDDIRREFGEEAVTELLESGSNKFIEGSLVEEEGGEEAAGNVGGLDSSEMAE